MTSEQPSAPASGDSRDAMNSGPSVAPLVSVAMITYNHGRFITQAIESVLAQRTDFPIELVVGDDASTDDTAGHIEALRARAPDVVRPIIRPANIGMHRNLEGVLAQCRGEFIAFLEGDDFWTGEDKLQIQADLLRADSSIVGVFHRASMVNASGRETGTVSSGELDEKIGTLELLRDVPWQYMIPTASVMVRRVACPVLPDGIEKLPVSDMPMVVFASLHGPWRFYPKVMAAYRIHDGGVWSGFSHMKKLEAHLKVYNYYVRWLPQPFCAAARQQLVRLHRKALELHLDALERALDDRSADARGELRDILRLLRYCEMRNGKRIVSALWATLSPRTHWAAKRMLHLVRK